MFKKIQFSSQFYILVSHISIQDRFRNNIQGHWYDTLLSSITVKMHYDD